MIRSFRKIVLRSLRWPSTVKPTVESKILSSIPLPLQPLSASNKSGFMIEVNELQNVTTVSILYEMKYLKYDLPL